MADVDRRDFLKLVGAGATSAAVAGCSDHVEKLVPYVVQPETITPGNPVVYASTCAECPAGCGLHIKTREGRPIKVEGNPAHPVNRGRLCARAQASVERNYAPDRFHGPMTRGVDEALSPISWEQALVRVTETIRAAQKSSPAGLRVHMLGGARGPTESALLDRIALTLGAGRTVYEPFAREALRAATQQVHGVEGEPIFDLEGADLVLDFGSELLDTGISPVEHARQWAAARDPETHPQGGARLVYVGARLSVTASSADEWLAAKPGSEGALALALARVAVESGAAKGAQFASAALADVDVEQVARDAGVEPAALRRLGRALAKAKHAVALPPGAAATTRRAVGAAASVLLLNQVLGGRGVRIAEGGGSGASYREVLALIKDMEAGRVGVLLIHDADPVYSLPAASGFAEALSKVGLVVSFATALDETSTRAGLVLPAHAVFERWGDAAPRPGVRSLIQPTLRPLHDTRALTDALSDIARALDAEAAAALPTGDFRAQLRAAWSDTDFHAALQKGGVFAEPAPAPKPPLRTNAEAIELAPPVLTGDGEFTLIAFPHSLLGAGEGAGLSLLQEIPDPITSVCWESWAEISRNTAAKLDVEMGDVLRVETTAGVVEVAAYVRGGIRDDVIAIPTGQGHSVGRFASKAGQGLAGVARGVNAFDLLPGDGVDESGGRAFLTENAQVTRTGRHRRLPMAQFNDNKRGRQLGEVLTLAALAALPEGGVNKPAAAAHGAHAEESAHAAHGAPAAHGAATGAAAHELRIPYDPADDAANAQYAATFDERGEASAQESPYRWGMSVDVDKCTGCSACIAACYVENNIPRVGEDESRLVRQMAWLRIDRWVGEGEAKFGTGRQFYHENHEQLGNTDVRNAPMFCQHCGTAPCEPVCPVIATYHNEEGLNAMVYNRCIGTRYCANNCPYKVRRFNYFDHQLTKWPEPMELGLNPDVTVRGQGVMEKCTMCIQRVQSARQEAKARGEEVPDGAVQTACQQTCPSNAIQFGNLRDANSRVRKKSDSKRGYHALHVLNTRPGVTYLAKVLRGEAGDET